MITTGVRDYCLCEIAELTVGIQAVGDLPHRCEKYLIANEKSIDLMIQERMFRYENWVSLSKTDAMYMESGKIFYAFLLNRSGMMLHSSAVELDGKAYLFSGPCGVGKSTHTRLWQQVYGEVAQVFNDDKPALRRMEDRWYAYGTPWCGKDGINQNMKVPLAGICFLKKGEENSIRRLDKQESISKVLSQTIHRFKKVENLDKMLKIADQLVREIPIYELTNKPEPEAALLSYETMRKGAEEAGL